MSRRRGVRAAAGAALAVAALTPAVAVAGCGSSDQDDVCDAYTEYREAVARNDGESACALLTAPAQRRLARVGSFRNCQDALSTLYENTRPELGEEIDEIEVDGNDATILFADDHAPARLERVDGDWRVGSLPPVGG